MPKNPLFEEYESPIEQELFDDLHKEAIDIKGLNVYYLPRTLVAPDNIFGEDTESRFNKAIKIVMWPQSATGFEGEGDLLLQFGFNIGERLVTMVSKTEFLHLMRVHKLDLIRPREGDLIFFPQSKGFFRISVVDKDYPFYQVGANYVFRITMDLFNYSHEIFETGHSDIDALAADQEHIVSIVLGNGSGDYEAGEVVYQGDSLEEAVASATVVNFTAPDILVLKRFKGSFNPLIGQLIGSESGASYLIENIELINVPGADNKTIQDAADEHLDFDESNPFGSY